MSTVFVFDPTAKDVQSKVRGVGRYLETLNEAFHKDWKFTADLKQVTKQDILINPFLNPINPPLSLFKKGRKQIAIIHDLIPQKYPKQFPIGLKGKLNKLLNNWTLRNYDLIVTDSEESKKSIVQILKIPPQKIEVIYATVPHLFCPHLAMYPDVDDPQHPFHEENGKTVAEFTILSLERVTNNPVLSKLNDFILYVGDATWNKNLVNLASTVKIANLTCVCVGKVFNTIPPDFLHKNPHPWQIPLHSFMKQVQGDPHFVFPGFISNVELMALYKKAKVNILLSYDEGFGLSYIEAGYMGTPSVLSDIPVFREIAGQAAEYVPATDPKVMAQKIVEVFYDKVKYEKMSIEVFDRAQNYSPDKFKKRWLEVLQKVQ
jgi:glycosyltransferase involved in cell wall biosynthesis